MPFGLGRYVRDHTRMKLELRQLAQLRAERDDARRAVLGYADAYRELLAELTGEPAEELRRPRRKPPARKQSRADRALARGLRDRATLTDRLTAGEPLESAVAGLVRRRLAARDPVLGRSLGHALQADPATRVAGQLGVALVAADQGLWELAWARFRAVPPGVWQRHAPQEYFRSALEADRDAALAGLRELVADPPGALAPESWVGLVGVAFGAGAEELAAELFEVAEMLAGKEPDRWAATAAERDWLRPWIGQLRRPAPPPTVPAGHVALAVLGYHQPDRSEASTNLGDYVQTVASLGHLVRHRNARFHGPSGLVATLDALRERVRPERRLDTPARDVTLVPVERDATNYCSVPEQTWMIAFGWHMQSMFGRYDFPLHPHLRPIFISFHCNRLAMLSPAAIEYLRAHAPIGCRDWSTVDLLLGAGVPAFFSGCLTTTVDTVFPDLDPWERPEPGAPVVYVDIEPPGGEEAISHAAERVQHDGLVANLRHAVDLMEAYRRRYSSVRTSRLHCYLPVRSIGVPVEFTPKRAADIRFNGLAELTDAEFDAMRGGILDRLAPVLRAILTGRGEDEVYATWREVCAQDVAAAQARRAQVSPMPPPSFDVAGACRLIRAAEVVTGPDRAPGDEVHVALALDGNLKEQLTVVVQAMVDNSSRPLHLWVLCRDHGPDDFARFGATFPEVRASWLPCDGVDYGPVRGMLRHITVSTMDRLLLPDLLPELDRIVYHDLDALPLGDVSELYDWDLRGLPLAARSSVAGDAVSGFDRIRRGARRVRNPEAAYDLLHRMHARHAHDFRGFNAGILVLDLARMRADRFGREFLGFVERYGMNDQEVLNCYAGPHRAELPAQWNAWPAQEQVTDAKIIHWAGPVKPWQPAYVALREVWAEYEDRLRHRQLQT
jgi:lipopolysaccharide biosynthesis glycosyltransferase